MFGLHHRLTKRRPSPLLLVLLPPLPAHNQVQVLLEIRSGAFSQARREVIRLTTHGQTLDVRHRLCQPEQAQLVAAVNCSSRNFQEHGPGAEPHSIPELALSEAQAGGGFNGSSWSGFGENWLL